MSQRGAIESPCVSLCQIDHETRLCVGCRRTLDEIGAWLQFSDRERRRIIEELPKRGRRE